MRKMNFVVVITIVLTMVPLFAMANSAESKRLFNQGQYAMGIIAAQGALDNYEALPEEKAASYYWKGKNQIAKGDVVEGIYSLKQAVKTKSSAVYTDELAQIVNKYAGKSMDYYRACESMMSTQQKALARKQLRSIYLSQVKVLLGKGDVSRAKSMAEKIHRFDSSVGPVFDRIFAQFALASNNSEKAGNSAKIALGYSVGEDKALGQKFLAMSNQIEKAEGPFDSRVDKFYQLAQKFDNSIPDNVVHCKFGEKTFFDIPSKGNFSPWYKTPNKRCKLQVYTKKGVKPRYVIYFSSDEGRKIVKPYLGEDFPSELNCVKVKFQSVDSDKIPVMILIKEYDDQRFASR